MSTSVLKDLSEMMGILRERGVITNAYSCDASVGYARAVYAELVLRGIEIPFPQSGDEINLTLKNKGNITFYVH